MNNKRKNSVWTKESYLDSGNDELVTTGFTWVDSLGRLHIHLPSLEDRLNQVGLTIVKFKMENEDG